MDKLTTLRETSHPENLVYPNIKRENIPTGAIDSTKLDTDAVTSPAINEGAVQTRHISPGAVGNDALAVDAVHDVNILDSSVSEAKLGPLSVSRGKIQDGAIGKNQIESGSVDQSRLDVVRGDFVSYLISEMGVVDFSSAYSAITHLIRDNLALSLVLSDGTDFYPLYYSCHGAGYIELGYVKGSFMVFATITDDVSWGQFASTYRLKIEMRFIR